MRHTISLFIIVCALLYALAAGAFQNEPAGFRGIKWGTHIQDVSNMRYLHPYKLDKRIRYYLRKNNKLIVGGIKVDKIRYGFANNRFYEIRISARGKENWLKLKDYMIKKYGKWTKNENSEYKSSKTGKNVVAEKYVWSGKVAYINFGYNPEFDRIHYNIYSEEIYDQELSGR